MPNISIQAAIWKHSLIWKTIQVQKSIISDEAVSIIHREQVYQISSQTYHIVWEHFDLG